MGGDLGEKIILLLALFGAALVGVRGYRFIRTRQRLMVPAELRRRLDDGEDILVVDLRDPEAFAEGHLSDAVNVPIAELPARLAAAKAELAGLRLTAVVLTCQTGARSSNALLQMEHAGLRRVRVLQGGLAAWKGAGFALVLPLSPAEAGERLGEGEEPL